MNTRNYRKRLSEFSVFKSMRERQKECLQPYFIISTICSIAAVVLIISLVLETQSYNAYVEDVMQRLNKNNMQLEEIYTSLQKK